MQAKIITLLTKIQEIFSVYYARVNIASSWEKLYGWCSQRWNAAPAWGAQSDKTLPWPWLGAKRLKFLDAQIPRVAQRQNVALCRGAQRLRWGGRAESLAQGFSLRLRFWPHIVGLRPILPSSRRNKQAKLFNHKTKDNKYRDVLTSGRRKACPGQVRLTPSPWHTSQH